MRERLHFWIDEATPEQLEAIFIFVRAFLHKNR